MAYTLVPCSVEVLERQVAGHEFLAEHLDAVRALWRHLRNDYMCEAPLSFDASNPVIKIVRKLEDQGVRLEPLRKAWSELKLVFGNGSAQKGADKDEIKTDNQGVMFERQVAQDLKDYAEHRKPGACIFSALITEMEQRIFGGRVISGVWWKGGKTGKRPLKTDAIGLTATKKVANEPVGLGVADIVITYDNLQQDYLSLKSGNEWMLMNSGIADFLPASDFEGDNLHPTTTEGAAMLATFGIDEEEFYRVFKSYEGKTGSDGQKRVVTYRGAELNGARRFVESIYAEGGYWVAHQGVAAIDCKDVYLDYVDQDYIVAHSAIDEMDIEFPKLGHTKQVNVHLLMSPICPWKSLLLEFRNTSGPTGVVPAQLNTKVYVAGKQRQYNKAGARKRLTRTA